MTMMGDQRECAKAVSALLTPRREAGPRVSERQAEEHERCFLFGHYDSRGGACLVAADNLVEAFEKYLCEAFMWSKDERTGRLEEPGMRDYLKDPAEYERWRKDALHSLMEEDFMFSCNVVVCDQTFEESGACDLDRGYDENGYRYGLLQFRWLHKYYLAESEDPAEREQAKVPSGWSNVSKGCQRTLVFWKGKAKPEVNVKALGMDYLEGLEVRIVRKGYGEDASGVSWIP